MYEVGDTCIFKMGSWLQVLARIEKLQGKIAHVRFAVPLRGQEHAQVLIADLKPSEETRKRWERKPNNLEELWESLPKYDINDLVKRITDAKKV
mgnify:CR=1 FL=1|tara:strand:+ start:1595 stop:1876 length:282 start_codon:yes stop_codon:yes gene_type:complete